MTRRTPKPVGSQLTRGDLIRRAIDEAGLSVQDVAERMGMRRQSVHRYVTDQVVPPADKLDHLARIVGCSIADLTPSASPHRPKVVIYEGGKEIFRRTITERISVEIWP